MKPTPSRFIPKPDFDTVRWKHIPARPGSTVSEYTVIWPLKRPDVKYRMSCYDHPAVPGGSPRVVCWYVDEIRKVRDDLTTMQIAKIGDAGQSGTCDTLEQAKQACCASVKRLMRLQDILGVQEGAADRLPSSVKWKEITGHHCWVPNPYFGIAKIGPLTLKVYDFTGGTASGPRYEWEVWQGEAPAKLIKHGLESTVWKAQRRAEAVARLNEAKPPASKLPVGRRWKTTKEETSQVGRYFKEEVMKWRGVTLIVRTHRDRSEWPLMSTWAAWASGKRLYGSRDYQRPEKSKQQAVNYLDRHVKLNQLTHQVSEGAPASKIPPQSGETLRWKQAGTSVDEQSAKEAAYKMALYWLKGHKVPVFEAKPKPSSKLPGSGIEDWLDHDRWTVSKLPGASVTIHKLRFKIPKWEIGYGHGYRYVSLVIRDTEAHTHYYGHRSAPVPASTTWSVYLQKNEYDDIDDGQAVICKAPAMDVAHAKQAVTQFIKDAPETARRIRLSMAARGESVSEFAAMLTGKVESNLHQPCIRFNTVPPHSAL